jgi:hypothetical protein
VEDKLFAALDRMVENGGQKVAKGAVVGDLAKKAADALLADLSAHKYIRKDGNKFTLTDEGRYAWESRASESRKQELTDRAVAEFLAVVVKVNAKALTAKQRQQFDEGFIKRVQAEGLVVGAGANKYKLSPKGEEFLQARELEEQLKRLRTAAQGLLKEPQALLAGLAKDTEQLAEGGAIRSAFAEARAAIQEEVARAQAGLERSLEGLQAFGSLLRVAQTLEKELPRAVSGALERIDAEAEQVRKLEAELRQRADQFREQMEQSREQMERWAAAVEERTRAERQSAGARGPAPAPSSAPAAEPPPDEVIWKATRRAYEQLEQRFKLTAELIKVPDLNDSVHAEVPELTVARFHDLLQRWQREDRLVLQVCNDPHVEPRSAEGIPSSRGLLFYVEMK